MLAEDSIFSKEFAIVLSRIQFEYHLIIVLLQGESIILLNRPCILEAVWLMHDNFDTWM